MKNSADAQFFAQLFVSERKQIAFMASEKLHSQVSRRLFATSRSEVRFIMTKEIELYGKYAAVSLVFSFYTLLEGVEETRAEYSKISQPFVEQLCRAITREDEDLSNLDEMRSKVTKQMEFLTAYTDRLMVYEYVLNRIEYRFHDQDKAMELLQKCHTDEWFNELMQFIINDKNPSIINDKVRAIMAQLPIRLTKQKFYEKIEGAMTLYVDGDYQALTDYIYRIRTGGMLFDQPEMHEQYPEFDQLVNKLKATDYSTISVEEYDKLVNEVEQSAKKISELTDIYYELESVINHVYALTLTKSDEQRPLLLQMVELYRTGGQLEEILPAFSALEGKIERYAMDTSRIEAKMVKSDSQSEDLLKLANLMSDSLFIDLYANNDSIIVTKNNVHTAMSELTKEFDQLFKDSNVLIKRAVMSQVLSNCPLMFHSLAEVANEIKTSLDTCADNEEMATVYELINMIING